MHTWSTNCADLETPARTWQISFRQRVCKMSPEWCLPSTGPNSSWGGARGGERKNVLPNSCCVTLSIAVRARLPNWGLFQKGSRRKHYAERHNITLSTIRLRLPITCTVCWCNNVCIASTIGPLCVDALQSKRHSWIHGQRSRNAHPLHASRIKIAGLPSQLTVEEKQLLQSWTRIP